MALRDRIPLRVDNTELEQVTVTPLNIQEILIVKQDEFYRIQIIMTSGRSYFLISETNKTFFSSIEEAQIVKNFLLKSMSEPSVTPNVIDPEFPPFPRDDRAPSTRLVYNELSIRAYTEDIPTKLSELENDTDFITIEDIPELPEVPTKLSELENDTGFITSADIPNIPVELSELINDTGFITIEVVPTELSELNNDTGFITIEDIPELPEVPTKLSELENDTNFITLEDLPTELSELNNDTGFITIEDVPTKLSELENDTGFITIEDLPELPATTWGDILDKPTVFPPSSHNHDELYYTKEESDTTVQQIFEVAEGKTKARVFDDQSDLDTWMSIPTNVSRLKIGDVFYTRSDDLDYWWDGEKLLDFTVETPDLVGYVQTTRTINNKELSEDIILTASDVNARSSNWVPSYSEISGTKPPTDAQKNVQSDWTEPNSNSDAFIKSKPTNLSDFSNDTGFITSADIPAIPTKLSELNNDTNFITLEDLPETFDGDYNSLTNKPVDLVFEVENISLLTPDEQLTITTQIVNTYVAGKHIDDFILSHDSVTTKYYHYESFIDDGVYITFIFRSSSYEIKLQVAMSLMGYEYTTITATLLLTLGETSSTAYAGDKGKAVTDDLNAYKVEVNNKIGNIDSALDAIIAIQNSILGV